ncbi:MAG: phosphoribosyl-ATP diphosphatase [Candidatus Nanopelagicales bacterium]
MKTFEELYTELSNKLAYAEESSGTVQRLAQEGVHGVGKKLIEEAAEAWMAAEFEGPERTAEEIAQLIYFTQVLILASGLTLTDVYRHL